MALKKAKLINVSAHDAVSSSSASVVGALTAGATENENEVEVMFNPTNYTVSTNMNYAGINVPGLKMPLLQFVRGESRVLATELFLDRSDTSLNLESDLAKLRKFVEIDEDLHAPPVVKFEWGRNRDFEGVITEFTETFQMFNDQGEVTRARVGISIRSYATAELQFQQLNRQSPDRTKTRVVKLGDRLDLIAMEEYGNPGEWRTIANANGITRPRLIRPGDVLIVPPL